MERRTRNRVTVGGLLALVAASGLVMSLLRPPDAEQAIRLARAHLSASNEFDYPEGYWTRGEWDAKRQIWRIGFRSAGGGGSSLLVDVYRDRSCRSVSDFSFFEAR